MERRALLKGMLLLAGAELIRSSPQAQGAAPGWKAYSDLAITGGAERCAIIGQDGTIWACSGANKPTYTMTIRDVKTLIADAVAKRSSGEMHFDGTKFTFVNTVEDAVIGKIADRSCGVQATSKTVVVLITKGQPKNAYAQLAPVITALQRVGM